MKSLHGAARPHDFESVIERQKGLEEILLGPEAKISLDEFFRIVKRGKDVVEVDENAGCKPGQNPQTFIQDVAIHGDDMAGIDEQDVVGLEGQEKVEGCVLHARRDEPRKAGKAALQVLRREGLDGGKLTGEAGLCIFAHRRREDHGRVAAADFNYALRFALSDEGVGHFGIDALKKTVVKVKIMSVMSGVFRKSGTFAGKREQVFLEPRDLFVKMKVETPRRDGMRSNLFRGRI